MPKSRTTSTRIADVNVDNDDIITITFKASADVDEYDVLDLNLTIRHFSKQVPTLKLVDSRENWSISPKAKKIAINESSLNNTIARAIVVSNNLKSSILTFLKKFETKKYPQQYFTDVETARAWLLTFNKKLI